MKFELNYEVDLSQPVLTQALKQPLFYSDSAAHELTITLKNGMFPEDASGYAYFIHMNTSVTERQALDFGEDGNVCSVEFPTIVYNTLGPISIVVQLVDGEEKTTILALAGEVRPSKSDTVVDCSGIVLPDIDDILDRLEQAEQDVADITATVRTGVRQDDSADFLYKSFFGDDSDFSITQNQNAKITKTGRLFTYTKYGTGGSTYYWVNLTGTTHRSFVGNDTQALPNIKSHDSDFIDIPGFVRNTMSYSSSGIHKIFAIENYIKISATSTSTGGNVIALRVIFRKYNEETGEYTYSSIYAPGTLIDYSYITGYGNTRIATVTIALSSDYNDAYAGRLGFVAYDQFAMYLQRRSQSLAGSVIIKPVFLTYMDSPLS